MTFLKLYGKRFVFLFGGSAPKDSQASEDVDSEDSKIKDAKPEDDQTSSDLIAIDIDTLTWEKIDVEDGPVVGRIQSSLVGIDDRLYVFGGKERHDGEEEIVPSLASYSIAEYMPDKKKLEVDRSRLPVPTSHTFAGLSRNSCIGL